jgi:hypothetical protein
MVFFRNFEGIFEIQKQRAVGNAEVRTNLFEKIPNPFGIFLLSVFFGLVGFFGKATAGSQCRICILTFSNKKKHKTH